MLFDPLARFSACAPCTKVHLVKPASTNTSSAQTQHSDMKCVDKVANLWKSNAFSALSVFLSLSLSYSSLFLLHVSGESAIVVSSKIRLCSMFAKSKWIPKLILLMCFFQDDRYQQITKCKMFPAVVGWVLRVMFVLRLRLF